MKATILYPDRLYDDGFIIEKSVISDNYELIGVKSFPPNEIDETLFKKAKALVTGIKLKIDKSIISILENCEIITRLGVGYDLIDIEECAKRDIPVCNVPDYGTCEVADHALALLMNFTRGISFYNNFLNENFMKNWDYSKVTSITRLSGKKVGVLGLGRIGTAFAMRAKSLGLEVVFYDPYVVDGQEKALNIEREKDLVNFISRIDFLSIHCLSNNETRGIIDKHILKEAKSNLIIINTARGDIINLEDAYKALKNKSIFGLAFDVFSKEPPDINHPLIKAYINKEEWIYNRLIITPHSAFYSPDSLLDLRKKAVKNCTNFLEGKGLSNCVNGF